MECRSLLFLPSSLPQFHHSEIMYSQININTVRYLFEEREKKKKKKRKITISTRSKDSLELQLQQLRDIAMEQRFPYSKNKITIVREDKLEKYLVRKLSLIHDFSIINSQLYSIYNWNDPSPSFFPSGLNFEIAEKLSLSPEQFLIKSAQSSV